MNIALVSGLIILILLVIMLIAGVPIAVALGISSVVAILPIMDLEVAVVTGAQRIFSGISMFRRYLPEMTYPHCSCGCWWVEAKLPFT